MDLFCQLGELALGSRLKRLSDRIMREGAKIYSVAGVPFEPRWFPVFYHLSRQERVAVTDIARDLGVTHSAVNQTTTEMINQGLMTSAKDPQDRRKRMLSLTENGQKLFAEMRPIWDDIRATMRQVVMETQADVIGVVERLEMALERESLDHRFRDRLKQRQRDAVEIVPYQHQYREDFERLNREWIDSIFRMEPRDKEVFADPQTHIIDAGGAIFFARDKNNNTCLGTVALAMWDDTTAELAKMAVTEAARGRQIGLVLGEAVLAAARKKKLKRVVLETNSLLAPALRLYRKLGFVEVPHERPSDYSRSDVFMVKHLVTP